MEEEDPTMTETTIAVLGLGEAGGAFAVDLVAGGAGGGGYAPPRHRAGGRHQLPRRGRRGPYRRADPERQPRIRGHYRVPRGGRAGQSGGGLGRPEHRRTG